MEPLLTRMLEQDARIQELDAAVRQKDRTIEGMKHWIKVAAEYKNDDPMRLIAGIQAALLKAAEYEGRAQNPKRKGRR